ncbi:hypothetical protein ACJX0J_023628, partial [Zea mays]
KLAVEVVPRIRLFDEMPKRHVRSLSQHPVTIPCVAVCVSEERNPIYVRTGNPCNSCLMFGVMRKSEIVIIIPNIDLVCDM